jgi:hypothetical protein
VDTSLVDAYLNEFKGNLFEYIVGAKIARSSKLEGQYFSSISPELKKKLQSYESFIRTNKATLISELDRYSTELVSGIEKYLPENITEIFLVGKIAKSSSTAGLSEADLLIKGDKLLPLSLKLSKWQSFVNTKSGGVKSFFSNYFCEFDSEDDQKELNSLVDRAFCEMSHKLHECVGLSFSGNWDSWVEQGLSELPGKLTKEHSDILKSYYLKIITFIHQIIVKYNKVNNQNFVNAIAPLMGFGSKDIFQVICFHDPKGRDGKLKKIMYLKNERIKIQKIDEKVINNSFFNIYLEHKVLQIRIKPMNKFTNTSLKINCSVKH